MSRLVSRISSAVGLLAAMTACPVFAQWSDDPASNLPIADRSGEQVQSKILPTSDGGFYISWFDNSTGGYDVYLQRLDAAGNEQFPHNGVLVADRDFSSTEDYGLDVDAEGNALLAFRLNDGAGVAQTVAQKVAPDGSLLWTPGGIVLSADAGGIHAPKIAATGDGTVGVAWSSSEGEVVVQKLTGAGAPLWGPDGLVIAPASGSYFLADLHGDADGNLIVSWVPYIGSSHELWTQKLAAADGSSLWGTEPVQVFDGSGGALQFGNFPPFIPDGTGGAVFVWYTVGATGQVHMQHILANGSAAFAQNGVPASTDDSQNHFEPNGAFDPASGDIYAVWRETDALQGQIGTYAQRIDDAGNRQWGDGGKVLAPLGATDQSQMRALVLDGDLLAAWVSDDGPNPMPIHVARIDDAGDYVFPTETVDIKTAATDTSRLAAAVSTDGYAAYSWTDNGFNFEGDVKAQNINPDGSLGNAAPADLIFANGFD
ncbi:MAG TPA: hypothetical protein VFG55_06135 [Rhodanobacteraceae bacterium]|nr:hypothetical protein [Rhodanobacteraceae bacterium]